MFRFGVVFLCRAVRVWGHSAVNAGAANVGRSIKRGAASTDAFRHRKINNLPFIDSRKLCFLTWPEVGTGLLNPLPGDEGACTDILDLHSLLQSRTASFDTGGPDFS